MRWRLGIVGVLLISLALLSLGGFCLASFKAEDMLFGYGSGGMQVGLGISQESIKPLGFFGYEKTGIAGYLTHDSTIDHLSSWFSGHKKIFVGNIGYTLELFVANIQRPILATFLSDVSPHIGAYGEYTRSYGKYGHGLMGQALLFVDESGDFEYSISPYLQLSEVGTWRISASLGTTFGIGLSYLEPTETLKLDALFTDEMKFSIHALLSPPELSLSIGAGWSQDKLQGFVRYSF